MRRPIKHILDDTVTDEAGNVVRTLALATGVTAADPYNVVQSQVNAGSAVLRKMKIMLDVHQNTSIASTGALDRFDWYIWFNVAGAQTKPDPRTAGTSDLKNQIFHMGSALLGGNTTASTNQGTAPVNRCTYDFDLFIPTWAQKINKDDEIQLIYVHSDTAANKWLKLKCIYMEYEQS